MKLKIAAALILAIFICIPVSSQSKNKRKVVLTGKIVNRDTIPVSNVLIFIDGVNTDIKSDLNGQFRLKFKPDIEKISFYSVGDGIFEIDYVGQERLEIIMNHEHSILSATPVMDVDLVETGYGKTNRDDVIGSVSSIKEDRFSNRYYSNVYAMIADEVPGVMVSGSSIRVRGQSSLNGSNEPLLVVDGSPVVSFEHISPSDVESISILKGSSTAIYGNRGAAGVVIIKTKSGGKK